MDAADRIAREVTARLPSTRPVLVGIAGAVSVGKSTTATALRDRLAADGVAVEVVGTDAFLRPNAELERDDLMMRKGFPESFDHDALGAFVRAARAGEPDLAVPVYSHDIYDRVPGARQAIAPADVLVIEGINALAPPVVDQLDIAVYLDADEEDVESWFVDRFLALCAAAADDATSFYNGFAGMTEAEQRAVAEWTWREINLVNLRDHIAPTRSAATIVLDKRRDHSLR